MKEIEVEKIVSDCTAQRYYDAVYATDAAMRAFHSKVNGDAAAVVGPWNSDGMRTVEFVMPMNVPIMLKKFIGMDSVPVAETQRIEWLTPGAAFKVVSEPQLNFPGANKFTTSGFLEVRSRPDGSCQLRGLVRCSAAIPWPMQATVEGLMATEATASIDAFLTFCQQFYASWRGEQLLQPERPATTAAAAASFAEHFYDAVDDEAALGGEGAGEGEEAETAVVPYQPPRLEDIIVDCLRQIQSSSAHAAESLRAIEELLRNMDDNMQVVRDKVVGRRPQPSGSGGPAATAPSSVGAKGSSGSGSGATSMSYVGFLATASLVCGVGVFVYVRYRLSAGGGGGSN